MKRIYILIALIVFTSFAFSQDFSYVDTLVEINGKVRPALKIQIDLNQSTVKKSWKSFLSKKYKIKLRGKNPMKAKGQMKPEMVNQAFDLFTFINSLEKERTELIFSMAYGYDIFISQQTYPKEYEMMKFMLNSYTEELNRTEYVYLLKSLEKDLSKEEKAKKKAEEKIKDLEESIEKSKKQMEKDKKKLEKTKNKSIPESDKKIQELLPKIEKAKKKAVLE